MDWYTSTISEVIDYKIEQILNSTRPFVLAHRTARRGNNIYQRFRKSL